jgi:flagellar biosynthetic protein FlhB
MAHDAGEKTESPTPRRREEAREKGQVARSNDLSAALLLLGGMIGLRFMGPNIMAVLIRSFRENLDVTDPSAFVSADVVSITASIGMALLSAAGPIMLLLVLLAVVSNVLQIGLRFTTQPLQPKLDKLNPITGFSRIFSARTVVQFVINLLKLGIVTLVAYYGIRGRMDQIMLALGVSGWPQLILISTVLYQLGLQLAFALLLIALLDFGWQRYKFERDLRMSKQEVKEEMRRMEGDPILKQRRRRMQLAAAMQHIRTTVPTADVVVTNPTELAIAIKYDAHQMSAPKVVAKGADFLAKRIREIAIQNAIPIVERKPLAQALYKTVEVGREVPEEFYKAIAEVLAYVYKLSGKSIPKRVSA